jgi:hypothetical protein
MTIIIVLNRAVLIRAIAAASPQRTIDGRGFQPFHSAFGPSWAELGPLVGRADNA